MAAGIGLRESRFCNEEAFKAIWGKSSDYILFECLDDEGQPQGCAVGEIETQYRCDADGGFLKLKYLLIQDPYYEHWVEENDGSNLHHHVCRRSLSGCQRKVGRQGLVHIQKWAFITAEDVEACQKEWKVNKLKEKLPGVGRGRKLEPMSLHSKSKPSKPAKKEASPEASPGDSQGDYESFEEEPATAKDKSGDSGRPRRRRRKTSHRDPEGRGSRHGKKRRSEEA